MENPKFPSPGNKSEQENGSVFAPKFDDKGLIAVFVTDVASGEPLMVGHMNAESLSKSLSWGEAYYWSRSRHELWHKGATSGNVQKIVEIRTDCDQDALWIKVEVAGHGATCHTGQRSCFFRIVDNSGETVRLLKSADAPLFNPKDVYGN